jgi:tryptophan 2,3-dioxygenase
VCFRYAEHPQLQVPYMLLQRLVDVDGLLAQWRHRHALVVQRTIGSKLGTGGSSGYGYLRAVIEPTRVFRDIANLATYVIRTSSIPKYNTFSSRSFSFLVHLGLPCNFSI